MTKLLIDSNIIIGLAKSHLPISIVTDHDLHVSEITRLEVFGYHRLGTKEEHLLKQFFENISCLNISHKIINQSIKYRKQKNMSIGDAIIAATAQNHQLSLLTANAKDFKNLENLEVINPAEDRD